MELTCEKCKSLYEIPDDFEDNYKQFKGKNHSLELFYRMNLTLCGTCRRNKIENAFKLLPSVLNTLTED